MEITKTSPFRVITCLAKKHNPAVSVYGRYRIAQLTFDAENEEVVVYKMSPSNKEYEYLQRIQNSNYYVAVYYERGEWERVCGWGHVKMSSSRLKQCFVWVRILGGTICLRY